VTGRNPVPSVIGSFIFIGLASPAITLKNVGWKRIEISNVNSCRAM